MSRVADILTGARTAFLADVTLAAAVPSGPEHRRSQKGGETWCVHFVTSAGKERSSCGIALHSYVLTVLIYGTESAIDASDLNEQMQDAINYDTLQPLITGLVDVQETDDEVDLEIEETESHDNLLARADWLIIIQGA